MQTVWTQSGPKNVGPDLNSNYLILILCIVTNSTDPAEIPTYIAFHQGDSLQKMPVLKGLVE